ncbi:MAG: sulfotransferase [Spirochaetales bacterium]|nr:sulfotransferase [Spirochaetales bacterium]MCF7939048.1 sulfotransferase [Spirochaetales bacterium]
MQAIQDMKEPLYRKKTGNLPNFLLVGAAKSGTTTLSYYLQQHPDIYMSPMKEPRFFSAASVPQELEGRGDRWSETTRIRKFDQYLRLFRNAGDEKCLGEASAEYLFYYQDVIPRVFDLLGDIPIIIILRNPVQRAFSAYKHLVRDYREDLDFDSALQREEEIGNRDFEFLWYYQQGGIYSPAVKAYLDSFSRVKIIIHESLKKAPLDTVREMYRFLEVDEAFTPRTAALNSSGIPQNPVLRRLLKPSQWNALVYRGLALAGLPDTILSSGLSLVGGKNRYHPSIPERSKQYLINYYREEVIRLEQLLGLELQHWLQ